MIKKILIASLLMFLSGCTDTSTAVNALQDAGFDDIEITGYNWFACAKDDFIHTGFIAKNLQGRIVKGTVCSGLFFNNATIRFN
jgi:hypothetical protein